jgi:GDPmannose 4,6-dehydratase
MLLGDAGKAEKLLGWKARMTCRELAHLMIDHDLELAQREARMLVG